MVAGMVNLTPPPSIDNIRRTFSTNDGPPSVALSIYPFPESNHSSFGWMGNGPKADLALSGRLLVNPLTKAHKSEEELHDRHDS